MVNKIILASGNKHKVEEFKKMLPNYEVVPMGEIGFHDDIDETGTTFDENSLIKAKAIYDYVNKNNLEKCLIVADDSGLCVNSLNGEPGVYSARYGGTHGDNVAARAKLLKNLEDKDDRSAYFTCHITVMFPDGSYKVVHGETEGQISKEELGNKDFCFDCLFYSNELGKTFGEATADEKNSVSHRGRAIEKLVEILK